MRFCIQFFVCLLFVTAVHCLPQDAVPASLDDASNAMVDPTDEPPVDLRVAVANTEGSPTDVISDPNSVYINSI